MFVTLPDTSAPLTTSFEIPQCPHNGAGDVLMLKEGHRSGDEVAAHPEAVGRRLLNVKVEVAVEHLNRALGSDK